MSRFLNSIFAAVAAPDAPNPDNKQEGGRLGRGILEFCVRMFVPDFEPHRSGLVTRRWGLAAGKWFGASATLTGRCRRCAQLSTGVLRIYGVEWVCFVWVGAQGERGMEFDGHWSVCLGAGERGKWCVYGCILFRGVG